MEGEANKVTSEAILDDLFAEVAAQNESFDPAVVLAADQSKKSNDKPKKSSKKKKKKSKDEEKEKKSDKDKKRSKSKSSKAKAVPSAYKETVNTEEEIKKAHKSRSRDDSKKRSKTHKDKKDRDKNSKSRSRKVSVESRSTVRDRDRNHKSKHPKPNQKTGGTQKEVRKVSLLVPVLQNNPATVKIVPLPTTSTFLPPPPPPPKTADLKRGKRRGKDSDTDPESEDEKPVQMNSEGLPVITRRRDRSASPANSYMGSYTGSGGTASSGIGLSNRFRYETSKNKLSRGSDLPSLPSREEMSKLVIPCCVDDPVGANMVSVVHDDGVYDVQPPEINVVATKMSAFLRKKGHDIPVTEEDQSTNETAAAKTNDAATTTGESPPPPDPKVAEPFPLSKSMFMKVPIIKESSFSDAFTPRSVQIHNKEAEKDKLTETDNGAAAAAGSLIAAEALAMIKNPELLDQAYQPPPLKKKFPTSKDAEHEDHLTLKPKIVQKPTKTLKKITIGQLQSKAAIKITQSSALDKSLDEEGELPISDVEAPEESEPELAEEDTDGELHEADESIAGGCASGPGLDADPLGLGLNKRDKEKASEGDKEDKKHRKKKKHSKDKDRKEKDRKVAVKKEKRSRSRSRTWSRSSSNDSKSPYRSGYKSYKDKDRRQRSRSPARRRKDGRGRSATWSKSRSRSPRRSSRTPDRSARYCNSGFLANNPRFGRSKREYEERKFKYGQRVKAEPTEDDMKQFPWSQGQKSAGERSRRYSGTRDRARSPSVRRRRRSRSRSRSRTVSKRAKRSRSKSVKREDASSPTPRDEDGRIDKKKLFDIARRNASAMLQLGTLQQLRNMSAEECAKLRAGGRSVDELVEHCRKIQKREKKSGGKDGEGSENEAERADADAAASSDDDRQSIEDIERLIKHPFAVNPLKALPNIHFNIPNSTNMIPKTAAMRALDEQTLRVAFPVSSGTQHREKESEWTPVLKGITAAPDAPKAITAGPASTEAANWSSTPKMPDATPGAPLPLALPEPPIAQPVDANPVFQNPPAAPKEDIGTIVNQRLEAVKKLQSNPNDTEAIKIIRNADNLMNTWAESKNLPGQFTGHSGLTALTAKQLAPDDNRYQAWARRDTFQTANAVASGVGMNLLIKMGWKPGQGLGRNNEGDLEPLSLDIKSDRKGLVTEEEVNVRMPRQQQHQPAQNMFQGKHPTSALMELCGRRRWNPPQFQCMESGPANNRRFLWKCIVNGVEYMPAVPANNKKNGKTQAAQVVLQSLGLVKRDASLPVVIG